MKLPDNKLSPFVRKVITVLALKAEMMAAISA